MDRNETLNISIPDEIQCENCKWAPVDARDYHCIKYKFKPSNVLYEGAKCEKFVASEDEEDDGRD